MFAIVSMEAAKSPFTEQQIQPSVSSHIFTFVASFRISPSTPEVPYSFSKIAISFLVRLASSLINVVLPAPKNPDTISIFIYLLKSLIPVQRTTPYRYLYNLFANMQ